MRALVIQHAEDGPGGHVSDWLAAHDARLDVFRIDADRGERDPGDYDLVVSLGSERAAEDIVEDARAREREIRLGAEDYADEILNTLEVNLSKFIAAVQRGRERLQGKDEPAEVS